MNEEIKYCEGCGMALRFLRTKRGKWAPVESFPVRYIPDKEGTVLFLEDGSTVRGRMVSDRDTWAPQAWLGHIGRCENPVHKEKRLTAAEKAEEAERVREARARNLRECEEYAEKLRQQRDREYLAQVTRKPFTVH